MKRYLFVLLLAGLCSFSKTPNLHPYKHYSICLDEPSDICLTTADPNHYYIVSNRGSIAETDSNGKVLRKTKYDGTDYEGVCVKDNMIYALDESLRKVDLFDEKEMKFKKSIRLHYGGGRNKGFEGLTYIPSEKKFIAVIEKPGIIFELDEQLHEMVEVELKQFGELSAVTYHDNYLWLLSDEAHEVMQVNISDYSIVNRWKVPVVNPEGISFEANGNLLILSDDMAMLFKFKIK